MEVWSSQKTPLEANEVFTGADQVKRGLLPGFTLGLAEIFAGVDAIPAEE